MRLTGVRALVTGATSGIGQAIAEAYGREGASVVVAGRDASRAEAVVRTLEAAGATATAIVADLRTPDGVAALLAAAGGGGGVVHKPRRPRPPPLPPRPRAAGPPRPPRPPPPTPPRSPAPPSTSPATRPASCTAPPSSSTEATPQLDDARHCCNAGRRTPSGSCKGSREPQYWPTSSTPPHERRESNPSHTDE